MIYIALVAKSTPIWAIISGGINYDIQNFVYVVAFISGAICFLLSFTAFVSAFVRFKLCYLPVPPLLFRNSFLVRPLFLRVIRSDPGYGHHSVPSGQRLAIETD